MATVPVFDPRRPDVHADPYPLYRSMRSLAPVSHVPSAGTWFVTSHEHSLAVLRDKRFSASKGQRLRLRRTALPPSMLTTDPPEHTRLRRAAAPAFEPAAMARVRAWMAPTAAAGVRDLCHALGSGDEVDLVSGFARPLAVSVLGRFLGMGQAELPELADWGAAVAVNLDPFADPDTDGHAARQMQQMLERFADHLHARSLRPADDALTVLARAHTAGALTPGDALSTAGLLVVGGLDPLTDLIGNAVAAMLGTSAAGLESGGRLRTVVEEFLRFDAPIQFTARQATEAVELGGQRVSAGDNVVVLLGAANRDPARFTDPDRVVPDRRTNPHLSFGAGPHACLGAPLARMFAELILEALPRPLPPFTAGHSPAVRRPATVPRGYQQLPIRRIAGQG
jgi:cytochrome P450